MESQSCLVIRPHPESSSAVTAVAVVAIFVTTRTYLGIEMRGHHSLFFFGPPPFGGLHTYLSLLHEISYFRTKKARLCLAAPSAERSSSWM